MEEIKNAHHLTCYWNESGDELQSPLEDIKIEFMPYEPNLIYHIYNQGNNKQNIFFEERNYLFFLQKMRKHILPYADFIAYCLMPNHFHWLVRVKPEGCQPSKMIKPQKKSLLSGGDFKSSPDLSEYQQQLSQKIAILLRSYTRAINNQENRSGSLFRKETKYKNGWIDEFVTTDSKNKNLIFASGDEYLFQCFEYIHHNPVKAGLVDDANKWIYSSAKDYAGLRNGTLCNQEIMSDKIGKIKSGDEWRQ